MTTTTGLRFSAPCSLVAVLLIALVPAPAPAQSDIACSCERLAQQYPDAVISDVRIVQRDIFETSDPVPSWFPRSTVNRLHIYTTQETIRENLLFKVGEPLNVERIRESQRKLNTLGIFREENLECEPVGPAEVRVLVSVKENWSLVPIFEIQGQGLGQAVTVGVTEQNLLGLDKSLSLSVRKGTREGNTIIEDAWQIAYEDPNILGTRYRLSWSIKGLETGEILTATFEKPYFSLETPWSLSFTNTHSELARHLFEGGSIAARYIQENNTSGMSIGYALKRGPPVVHRVRFFYQYEQQRIHDFRRAAGAPTDLVSPPDSTFSYPGIGYQRLGVHYIAEQRIDRFHRNEYINIGNDLIASLGFSGEALGADRDEWIFHLTEAQGYRFRKGHFLMATASAQGTWRDDRIHNGIFRVTYDHYLRETFADRGPFRHTFHLQGDVRYGENLDSNRRFGLGYTTGLRGYEINAFTGNKLARLTLEDRMFSKKEIFGVVALGLLLFWDCGYVWEQGRDVDVEDLRNDVGIGLRTAIPSATGANVLQFNWGFPVDSSTSSLQDVIFTVMVSSTFD